MKKLTIYSFLVLCVIIGSTAFAQSADVEDGTTSVQVTSTTEAVIQILPERSAVLLYDNGPHFNIPGSPNISLLEDQTLGLNTLGANASEGGGFSIADDFTLAEDSDITNVDLYGYQTNAPSSPASIMGVYIQIWDGDPSGAGTVVWGNFIDDLFAGAIWSNTYRESETNPGTNRAIQLVAADTPGLSLTAGDYWIDWQYIGDGAFSGPWQPPVVELGVPPNGNALQSNAGVYGPWLDSGANADPMDGPFQIYGTPILGVSESTLYNQVSVFPNPAQSEINISNVSSTNLEMAKIFDMGGKLIQSVDLSEMTSQISIDVSSYAAGMYMVQISTANAKITKKFMKQ